MISFTVGVRVKVRVKFSVGLWVVLRANFNGA